MMKKLTLLTFIIISTFSSYSQGIEIHIAVNEKTEVTDPTWISLKPGFHFQAGSDVDFHAYIGEAASTTLPSGSTVTSLPTYGTQNTSVSGDQNYIRVWSPRIAMSSISTYNGDEVAETVQYFDGLGRPSQTIMVKASPNQKDMVQLFEYDDFGREARKYLPYELGDADNLGAFVSLAGQTVREDTVKGFYGRLLGTDDANYPWAETVFEASPLNRVLEQGAPGEAWQPGDVEGQGKVVKTDYLTNSESVSSYRYNAGTNSYDSITYAPNTLYVLQTTDANESVSREYKDFEGNVVRKENILTTLKEAEEGELIQVGETTNDTLVTLYIYDIFGQLACVMPPLAVKNGIAPDPDAEELCYHYRYNSRRLMEDKKIPGAGWVYMVYDARDRLVLSQDSNMRADDVDTYLQTYYDELNRPVQTAEVTYNNSPSLESLREGYEDDIEYHSNLSFSKLKILTKMYYDEYPTFLASSTYDEFQPQDVSLVDAEGSSNVIFEAGTEASSNKGRVCFQLELVEDPVESTYGAIYTVYYYDKYGRVVQTTSSNYIGGIERTTTQYDFRGTPLQEVYTHSSEIDGESTSFTLNTVFTYDHRDRLLATQCQLDEDDWVTVSANQYDALGQLITKYTHSVDGATFLQKTDYAYNIRGWLTAINSPELDEDENDVFGMQLTYNEGSNPQYNGNISSITWKNRNNSDLSHYDFTYDGLNRLTNADFGIQSSLTASLTETFAYDVDMGYDANGNIMHLYRNSDENSELITDYLDYLTYDYKNNNNSNQLVNVTDMGGDLAGFPDYPSGSSGNYLYDGNGNMIHDGAKGVDHIDYNYLNLPTVVTGDAGNTGSMAFHYSATGQKLRKQLFTGTDLTGEVTTARMDYAGRAVYKDNTLQYIFTSEGRIVYDDINDNFTWQYDIKDHLGNTRAVIEELTEGTATVKQQTHYYPFGLEMPGKGSGLSRDEQPYLYNGKESVNDMDLGWLDYGARMYDASLGRFFTQDRFAEKYYPLSPYQYAANNPISNIDINGDSIWVTVTSSVTDDDGNISEVTESYYYGSDSEGNYGFLDKSGKLYSGNDALISEVTTALNTIREGSAGKAMVDYLSGSVKSLKIVESSKGNYVYDAVYWDPNDENGGPNMEGGNSRPPFIGLAHELAHFQDLWKGTWSDEPWVRGSNGNPNINVGEQYATHVENQIRAEHDVPLRTHYNGDKKTRIVNVNGESLYYFEYPSSLLNSGRVTPFKYNK